MLPYEQAKQENGPDDSISTVFMGRKFNWDLQTHNPISVRIQEIFEKHHITETPLHFIAYDLGLQALIEQAELSGPNSTYNDSALNDFTNHYANVSSVLSSNAWYRVLQTNASEASVGLDAVSIQNDLDKTLDPVISKAMARDALKSVNEEGIDTDRSGSILAMMYIALLLSGKNAFKNEMMQKIDAMLAAFQSENPTVATITATLGMHTEPPGIASLPSAIHREKLANPIGYANAKQMLPVYSGFMLFQNNIKKLDLVSARAAAIEVAEYLFSEGVIEAISSAISPSETDHDDPLKEFKPMELDWSILPPGELEDSARDLVRTIQQDRPEKEITIDLERLRSLEEIREAWGNDKSYYVRGALKQRRVIRKDGKECPDEYIVLVLQDFDDKNNLRAEHAVAESPIVGPHAMYVYRQDAGEGFSWRDVMAMSKRDAKLFNARALKHTQNGPTVAEKATYLLKASKEGFLSTKNYRLTNFSLPRGLIEVDN